MTKLELTEEELQSKIDETVSGLKAKNNELILELRKIRKNGDITPEQFSELETERDKALADLAKANKELKAANTTAEKAQKALQSESAFTQRLLIDNGLTAELTKNNVTLPHMLKAAQAMLRSNVQIEIDGDNRVAKFGDKALSEAIKEWAASDEGKHFVSATVNGGGGGTGGTGGTGDKSTMTRTAFSALTPDKKVELSKKGITLTE